LAEAHRLFGELKEERRLARVTRVHFSFAFAGGTGNFRRMTDEESSKPESSSAPAKRARRSRRGGRGRRRRTVAPASETPSEPSGVADEPMGSGEPESVAEPEITEAPMADSPIEEARREAADAAIEEERESYEPGAEPSERAYQETRERRDFRPASPAAVTEAIEEVSRIITSLQEVLDQMEEVLETLEVAEAQKTADEREIQSLRHSLRQLDRRGGGGNEPRRESHSHQSHAQTRHEPRRGRR
jgi:hypothetical protein